MDKTVKEVRINKIKHNSQIVPNMAKISSKPTHNLLIKLIIRLINHNKISNNSHSLLHKDLYHPLIHNLINLLSKMIIMYKILVNKLIKIFKGHNKLFRVIQVNQQLHNLIRLLYKIAKILINHNKDSKILLIMQMRHYLKPSRSK